MLDLRLLGPIQARLDDRPVPLGPPQRRALLAALALQPGVVLGVDTLVGALWGERAPGSAVNIVQGYVARLRAVLEPGRPPSVLLTRPPGYLLAVPAEQIDVGRFLGLVTRGRRERADDPHAASATLREALALWRGEPLADLGDLPVARTAREHLAELRRAALAERIDADLDVGRDAELVAELEALVAADPLREHGHRQLMLALYRAGRAADALAAFAAARRVLAEELGLDPGPALRALETAILRHDVPPPAAPRPPTGPARPAALPASLTSFVGRDAELGELRALLGERRLVTLTGPGGAGKTRLAVAAVTGAGPEGEVYLVDLVPVTGDDDVPAVVAAALGVRVPVGEPALGILGDCLRSARVLVVLDNCEHVVEGCAVLADALLAAGPAVRVLATSRQPLGVVGETVWPVPGLATAAAVRLFAERAAAPFQLSADTRPVVERICRRLDGMPLAIELAAVRTRMLSAAEIEVRLDDRFGLLSAARRGGPARHRTLSAVIDWSYRLLTEPERTLFERLSVFAGDFGLDEVEAVVDVPPGAVDTLAALVDKSLVTRTEGRAGRSRYRLLDTLRQFAADLLGQRGEAELVRARHAEHYAALAERFAPLVAGRAPEGWLDRLEEAGANLRSAVTWSLREGDGSAAAAIMGAAWWQWWVRGPLDEGRELVEAALRRTADPTPPTRARLLYGVGSFALTQGELDRVEQVGRECHQMSVAQGDDMGAGWGVACLGLAAWARGNYDAAHELIERTVALARRSGDAWHVALGLGGLGRLAVDQGDDARAEELLERAVAAARAVNQPQALGFALDQLATLAYRRHRDAEALERAGQALAAYRDAGSQEGIGSALRTIGRVAFRRGDVGRAAALHRDRLVSYRRHGNLGPLAACLEDFADIALALDRPREAARLLAAADALRAEHGTAVPAPEREHHRRLLAQLRTLLTDPDFDRAWADGRAMGLDAALRAAESLAGVPWAAQQHDHQATTAATAE